MNSYSVLEIGIYDNLEVVTDISESTIVKPNQSIYKLGISITRDAMGRNFMFDPYFKVYIGRDAEHPTKVARLAIYRPEYIIHYKDATGINWFFNNKEKKNLIKLLESKYTRSDDNGRNTVWDAILRDCVNTYEDEIIKLGIDKNKFLVTKMPDYMKLEKK